MDSRIEKLINSLKKNYRYWDEEFVNEETGEIETIQRSEIISRYITDEERDLMESIAADANNLSVMDLKSFISETSSFWPHNNDEFYLSLVNHDEKYASYIDNPAILQQLCDSGNRYAAYELYMKYCYGDEGNGIFIDEERSKTYYDLAGDIPHKENWGAMYYEYSWQKAISNPKNYKYILSGDVSTLDTIEALVNDLYQRFGTRCDVEGLLYVPDLMKVFVGSDSEYYGDYVMTMERESSDRLVISTEAVSSIPLLYALRQCFENIKVEVEFENSKPIPSFPLDDDINY